MHNAKEIEKASLGALLLGAAADRRRKRNIGTEILLACVGGLLILAEFVLILRIPLPSILPWSMVSIAGAATVLSFPSDAKVQPRGKVKPKAPSEEEGQCRLGQANVPMHVGLRLSKIRPVIRFRRPAPQPAK